MSEPRWDYRYGIWNYVLDVGPGGTVSVLGRVRQGTDGGWFGSCPADEKQIAFNTLDEAKAFVVREVRAREEYR